MKDCWNSIGVRGDKSCPELAEHVHCRNCPVYSAAARDVLDGELPASYLSDWTRHFARPKADVAGNSGSLLVFRIGAEWLGLSTTVIREITECRTVHSLPHRAAGPVLGLVNVRGELLVCVSLALLLGLDASASARAPKLRPAQQRFLVIAREGVRVVCAADELDGIQPFQSRDLKAVPSTVAKAATPHSRGVLSTKTRSVGVLDDQRLFQAIQRDLA